MEASVSNTAESPLSQLERRLMEAYDGLWNNFVDPRADYFDETGSAWLPLSTQPDQRSASAPAFTTEAEHRALRAECRSLAVNNEFAINAHENRLSYIIGAGHTYHATPRKNSSAGAVDLAVRVQSLIDEFIEDNHWQRRQQETVLRVDRDGEAFLRFFIDPGGRTRVRFVEPGQITTPPDHVGNAADSFGVRADPDDVETVLGYFVDGVLIDASDIQHRKANVDANVKRGLPLFYPVRRNLERAEKLLRNMSVVSEIQSAIALIRRHRNGTRTAIQQFIQQQSDATSAQPSSRGPSFVKRYAPGTILDAHADVDYEFPTAGLDAGSFVTVLQAELRAIASRLVMPEFMLTSDASNANYSSTLVAETPAVRMFERLQAVQIEEDRAVMRRVVRNACAVGALPPAALTDVELQIEPPTLAMRDRLQETQIYKIQHDSGILSPQTWSTLSGLDYGQEQMNLAQSRETSKKVSND